MEKAFDCVDRNLLSLGVGVKMYNWLKCIYSSCKVSEFFLTLIWLYINDIVQKPKQGSGGIQKEFYRCQCLMYTNDISSSQKDLQNILNILYNWF